MKRFLSWLSAGSTSLLQWGGQGFLVSAFVLFVVAIILVPISPHFLDLLILVNIVLALVLLLRSMSLSDPVRFFSFPAILLFATLLRLALNVSSTRLILLNGEQGTAVAGQVIESFGMFVVQGDFIVGAILFGIIAVVNFLVIAKGSARVAEVAARFALDSLPGKQLTIDAELRAGNITSAEATKKRRELAGESQFYGAMDGAMKFVQGDAIAGLIIVGINAIGGVSIGLSRGMTFEEALATFGILTIGDGIANILPSLLMSLCAGVIVTHVSGSERRGTAGEMFIQIFGDYRPLMVAGGFLILGSIVPGFPFLPFLLTGLFLLAVAYGLWGHGIDGQGNTGEHAASATADKSSIVIEPGGIEARNDDFCLLAVEIDPEVLLPFLSSNAQLRSEMAAFYREKVAQLFSQRGVRLPELRLRVNQQLERGAYRVLVREEIIEQGQVDPALFFAEISESSLRALGMTSSIPGQHPLRMQPSSWLPLKEQERRTLWELGVEVLSADRYLALAAIGAGLRQIDELFGLDEVKGQLAGLRAQHRLVMEEVFDGNLVTYAEFTEVLRRLVREQVSIRDLKLIVEGVAEFASANREIDDRQQWLAELHAFLRLILARGILNEATQGRESLRVFVLSSETEDEFRSVLTLWDQGRSHPPMEPEAEARIRSKALKLFHPVFDRGALPVVLLCASDIRPLVHEFFGRLLRSREWVRTMAFQELPSHTQTESVGML